MTTGGRVELIALLGLMLLGVPERALLAPERPDAGPPKVTGPQEVEVVAVLMDQGTQQPTVLLQGKRDKRPLAMAIGLAEATGIPVPLQGRLEDVFAKLGEKFGDLTGRLETDIRPTVPFDDVGGVRQAKVELRGFAVALTDPDRYSQWGITPPKGLLLYGPPGTGKTKLAKALATASAAVFFHLKLTNLTSKFGANTGELLQEILKIAMGEGRAVLFLDEAEALSLEHLLPPPQAREASARLVAALCEKLDAMDSATRILVVATATRTDALDPALVAPGRLDHLIEIALPDTDAQREILDLVRARTETHAGGQPFAPIG